MTARFALRAAGSLAALAATFAAAPNALAQDAAQAETDDSAYGAIIVTANKRAQSVQDIAGAVTALGGENLLNRGINNLDQVTQAAPAMTFYTMSGSTFITLRGVGVPVDTGASDPNTVVSFDGVNLPRAGAATIDLFDIQRVEVARGPQGTLYGRNAIGGAINFIGRDPTDTLTGQFQAGYGNYDSYKINGTVSGPLGEGIAVRLSASRSDRNKGFVKNLYDPSKSIDQYENTTFRGALQVKREGWQMDLSVTNHYERFHSFQQVMGGTANVPGSVAAPSGSGGLIPIYLTPNIQYSVEPWEAYSSFVNWSRKNVTVVSLRNNFDLTDDIQLRSITGYVKYRFHSSLDGTATVPSAEILPAPEDGFEFGRTQPSEMFSQEINIAGKFGDGGSWVVGGYFSDEKFRVDIPIWLPTNLGYATNAANPILDGNTAINFDARYRERTLAVFADATVPLTSRLRLYGGARYAREENKTKYESALLIFPFGYGNKGQTIQGVPGTIPVADGCAALSGGALTNNTRYDFKWNPFTPRAGVQYDVGDRAMVYGQYSRGFKVGGTAATLCGNTYGPEHLDAFEGGLKSQMFDGKLTANFAVYYYKYAGMQIYQGVGAAVAQVVNADARTLGLDIELQAHFNDIVSADISGSILDAKFHNFASTDATDPNNTRGLPTVLVNGVATPNLDGNRLPGVPDYNFTAGLQADIPLGLGLFDHVLIRGEGNFIGKSDIGGWERPETIQPAFVKLNAVVAFRNEEKGMSLRFWGRNLTNKATTYHYLWNGGVNVWSGQYSPPRTYGVEFTKDF